MTDETIIDDGETAHCVQPAPKRRVGVYRGERRIVWDASAIERLTVLVQRGVETSVIAEQFGTSRSGIIGKCARLGLRLKSARSENPGAPRRKRNPGGKPGPRPRPAPTAAAPHQQFAAVVAKPAPEPFEARALASEPSEFGKPLLDLSVDECHWPIGDPRDGSFHFCGKRGLSGASPYCGRHAHIAYQPRDTQRNRKW